MEYIMTNVASLNDLLNLSRKDYDDTAKAEKSRIAFIDKLIAEGFTASNIGGQKKGSNVDPKWRKAALVIAAGTIKIKGKRLSDADLKKVASEEVSNKVLLAGIPKGTMKDTVTWLGNASSYVGKLKNDLEKREAEKLAEKAGTPAGTPRTNKNAPKDVFLGYLQKAYNLTFKENTIPTKDLAEVQKHLRDTAKGVGGTLNAPKQK
jgi:hypothetical protein